MHTRKIKPRIIIIASPFGKKDYLYRRARFVEEGKKRPLRLEMVNPYAASAHFDGKGHITIMAKGRCIDPYAHAVYRTTISSSPGTLLENYFIDHGARHFWLARRGARRCAFGKVAMYHRFTLEKIPFPRSFYLTSQEMVTPCLEHFHHRFPLVLKAEMIPSTCGIGVMLAESKVAFKALVDFCLSQNINVLVQEFIKESAGIDYRVIVLDDCILGAVRRDNRGNDFRSNVFLGATPKRTKVPEEVQEVAIAATRAVGSRFGGVDVVLSQRGPLVLEVNNPCDFSFVENVAKVNIAGAILDALLAS